MKKAIGLLGTKTFYVLGDFVCRIMFKYQKFGFLYPIYNRLMTWSCNIQLWSGCKGGWVEDSDDYEEYINSLKK